MFKISNYKPAIVKSGYDNNYIEYRSEGDKYEGDKGGSYTDSPKWLKDKKSTINPKNNDYKCFQYALTLALNLDKIDKNSQKISKIKPFIEEYNWKDIDFYIYN